MISKTTRQDKPMKSFRTQPDRNCDIYDITKENFEGQTGNKYPFEQPGGDGKVRQYAYCPACLNPVQIIGLWEKNKVPPYARHAGKDVPGMAGWNYEKYDKCVFASHNRRDPIDDDKLLIIDDDAVKMYEYLKDHFDQVVIFISHELSIRGSARFWENALKQFLINRGYCYRMLTDINLPYVFAYRGLQHRNLWNAAIKSDSDLYHAISAHPGACFADNGGEYRYLTKGGRFINLQFRFTQHKINVSDHEFTESVRFCIDELVKNETVYDTVLEFNEFTFQNACKRITNRQEWLLDIARKNMPPIETNV